MGISWRIIRGLVNMEGHQIDCIFLSMVSQSFYHGSITASSIEKRIRLIQFHLIFMLLCPRIRKTFPLDRDIKKVKMNALRTSMLSVFKKEDVKNNPMRKILFLSLCGKFLSRAKKKTDIKTFPGNKAASRNHFSLCE